MVLHPSGFVECSPTPAVEANSLLLAKNGKETGKQIFGLYGLAQGANDLKDYALPFVIIFMLL
jgi:hypothetical protein